MRTWRICSRRFISCPTCCTLLELSVRACSKCWCSCKTERVSSQLASGPVESAPLQLFSHLKSIYYSFLFSRSSRLALLFCSLLPRSPLDSRQMHRSYDQESHRAGGGGSVNHSPARARGVGLSLVAPCLQLREARK